MINVTGNVLRKRYGVSSLETGYSPSFPRWWSCNVYVTISFLSLLRLKPPRSFHHHSRLNISPSGGGNDVGASSSDPAPLLPGRANSPGTGSSGYLYRHRHSPSDPCYHHHRPRQNSVVVFATAHFLTAARRVKSAADLQTMVLREETEESVHALTNGNNKGSTVLHSGAITCVWKTKVSRTICMIVFKICFL